MANLRTFNLNPLKVFDALTTEGPTVAAGRRIGLPQPAVSAALRRKTVVTAPTFSDIARLVQEADLIGALPGLMVRKIAEEGSSWRFPAGGLTGDLPEGIQWHRRNRGAAHHRWFRALMCEESRAVHGPLA
ncbi:hypothetical protein JQU17_05595 [Ponticoccus sp. SC2-23]|uniref:hypothetical protein n=1 Tax=Alexandriicola marinus TaxID=2081710 RepID=UPI000FD93937|nr:hypothetical protein [Alexandriicola marinus]MBM1219664.1 hypothetical protein [Ponticoccus sp. SC6-9]MBM1223264.1 hypothetical protein [Ponticoccus sp. SC6-15]MBM1229477.1 hypothetical protein [Ponticoccus sp. SC6-38]MBM1232230.1 hypothetical protein [Ponticoccus sp. SC6-45]MBM1237820.1 hypothetical protein [Ponticoccus sp. SC6-49]MBM1241241.1 hypothetical protein [Ponticoccus sp. SC2-64]MBM1245754.1 hypothetical protein [Ponticoccus sp. SC6-42]MBM1250232.1 hypothetical protein [Pontico